MTWKEKLADKMPRELADEIDVYETQLELRKLGKIDEKLFAETRLRRGAYGQRYDNGQRHDGMKTQHLHFPARRLPKGPDTMWDAPGMQRIKIPFGGLTPRRSKRWPTAPRSIPTASCTSPPGRIFNFISCTSKTRRR